MIMVQLWYNGPQNSILIIKASILFIYGPEKVK